MSTPKPKNFVCQVEGRRFANAAALAKHRAMVHPNCANTRGRGRGRGRGNGRGGFVSTGRDRIISGIDILGSYLVTTASALGLIVTASPITPRAFPKTRFAREAELFNRWRPVKMQIEVVPTAGTMTSGSYTLAWSGDPDDWIDSTPESVTLLAAMVPSTTSLIYKPARITLPNRVTQNWLLCDNTEPADSCHGRYYVCLSGSIGNITANSEVSLVVKLHWSVKFIDPSLPRSVSTGNTIYAQSGYENYFTDSVSDWADGKKLTLKHSEGGSVVPFVGLQPETVYKLDPSAKLQAYDKDGVAYSISYGVKIQNYSVDGLALFTDLEKAKKYAKTADNAHCKQYYKAGPVITPSNPAWISQETVKLSKHSSEIASLQRQIRLLTERVQALALPSTSPASPSGSFLDLAQELNPPR